MTDQDFIPLEVVNASSKSRHPSRGKGILSIVYCKGNNRILISAELATELQLDESVQFGFQDKYLVVGKRLPKTETSFTLKKHGRKYIVYSVMAVREIIHRLKLDFRKKVSHTFYSVKIDEWDNIPIAKVWKETTENHESKN